MCSFHSWLLHCCYGNGSMFFLLLFMTLKNIIHRTQHETWLMASHQRAEELELHSLIWRIYVSCSDWNRWERRNMPAWTDFALVFVCETVRHIIQYKCLLCQGQFHEPSYFCGLKDFPSTQYSNLMHDMELFIVLNSNESENNKNIQWLSKSLYTPVKMDGFLIQLNICRVRAVQTRYQVNLTELQCFCKEEWQKYC